MTLLANRGRISIVILASAINLSATRQPTFSTSTNLITINVEIKDKDGRFVTGLRPSDFSLTEDGIPQRIDVFDFIDIPLVIADIGQSRVSAPDNEPAIPEKHGDRRSFAFVLDDIHLSWSRVERVKRFMSRFIRESLGDDDVGLVQLTSMPLNGEFSGDRQSLLTAIDRLRGFGRGSQFGTHPSLNALRDLSTRFIGLPGRKTVLFVSEMIGCQLIDESPRPGAITDTDLCRGDLDAAIRTAALANTTIYTIDPRGLTALPLNAAENRSGRNGIRSLRSANIAELLRLEPLRALAEETGGFAVLSSNNFDAALKRIVREVSTYYTLGYYSKSGSPGTIHHNHIAVARKDVTLRYRERFAELFCRLQQSHE